MVTTASAHAPSFEAYYNLDQPPSATTEKGIDTFTVVLIGGLVVVSALSVYIAIKNHDLRKQIKERDAKRFEIS